MLQAFIIAIAFMLIQNTPFTGEKIVHVAAHFVQNVSTSLKTFIDTGRLHISKLFLFFSSIWIPPHCSFKVVSIF